MTARAELVLAVQYYHRAFEHYFVSADPDEVAMLDRGMLAGWSRTGTRFRVDNAPGPELSPVCRFYTSAFAGRASHFFTASAGECELVKRNPAWTYEGIAFYARVSDTRGSCGSAASPVYRLYNNGHDGAPNHAYVVDAYHRDALIAADWFFEGVAYCAELSGADAVSETAALAATTWEFPDPPDYFGPGVIRTRFAVNVQTSGMLDSRFRSYGAQPLSATIYHQVNDAWTGVAGFEGLTGKLIVLGSSGFEGDDVAGVAWELDSARSGSSPVCSMVVTRNFVDRTKFVLHPFQPYLWTGCEGGVARRS